MAGGAAPGLGGCAVCAPRRGGLHLLWQVGPMSAQLARQPSAAGTACERRGGRRTLAGPSASAVARAPAPPLHARRTRPGSRPARPDGMPAAMLPYACILLLWGGRCLRSPTGSMPEVEGEGARRLTSLRSLGDCCTGVSTGRRCVLCASPAPPGWHLPCPGAPPGRGSGQVPAPQLCVPLGA